MAKKKSAKSKRKKSTMKGNCQIVRNCGQRRKICRDSKGRIKSNRAA